MYVKIAISKWSIFTHAMQLSSTVVFVRGAAAVGEEKVGSKDAVPVFGLVSFDALFIPDSV
jgi:hypothetical protein